MMKSIARLRRSGVTLVVTLLLLSNQAACGSANTDGADAGAPPSGAAPSEPDADRARTELAESPLERALGGVDAIVAQRLRAIEAREREVQSCMADRGFDYEPYVPSARSVRYDYEVFKYEVLIADPEFRAQWGYGIATRFDEDGQPYAYDGAVLVRAAADVPVDPNGEHVLSLAPARRQAWEAAMFGQQDQTADEGCLQVAGERFDRRYPAFASLTSLEEDLAARTRSSDDLSRAVDEWVTCMVEHGYNVSDPINPAGEIDVEVSQLQATGRVAGPQLEALKERELSMAAQDWTCRETTINPIRRALVEETETDFLERVPDLLDDLERQGP